jgi:general secretion pathway protein A
MSTKKMLALYGLKWNPFSQDIPHEAIHVTPAINSFCYRVENLVMEGGFALLTGDSGTGKSVTLRMLDSRLSEIREISSGVITRPQSNVIDFYREISAIFSIDLRSGNRWGSYKALREKWLSQIKATLFRPVLIIDEAQEMEIKVLSELRFLTSSRFDSYNLMSVVLCGDNRLIEKLKHPDLIPLGTRMKARHMMEQVSKDDLKELLSETIRKAGNHNLMTPGLINTLAEHSLGNYRVMMNVAGTLLYAGMEKELKQLDEKLYLDLFHQRPRAKGTGKKSLSERPLQ